MKIQSPGKTQQKNERNFSSAKFYSERKEDLITEKDVKLLVARLLLHCKSTNESLRINQPSHYKVKTKAELAARI